MGLEARKYSQELFSQELMIEKTERRNENILMKNTKIKKRLSL